MYEELVKKMNEAVVAVQKTRDNLTDNDPKAALLDGMLAALKNDRAIITQNAVRDALKSLTDANVLDHLSGLSKHLQATTTYLNKEANDLNVAATIVSTAASIVAMLLFLH